MSITDRQLGETVQTLRGDASQQSVADGMKALGWSKWSQSTVWSVERGDRPLRLAEAVDLVTVLRTSLDALLSAPQPDDEVSQAEYDYLLARIEEGRALAAYEQTTKHAEELRARISELEARRG